jgi:hypothetical protein
MPLTPVIRKYVTQSTAESNATYACLTLMHPFSCPNLHRGQQEPSPSYWHDKEEEKKKKVQHS